MINKIIRNFIAKQIAGRSDDGIMITLKDPQRVTLGENIMADLLIRNGIDPRIIKSEQELKLILQRIENAQAAAIRNTGIRNTESAKVFNIEGQSLDPNKPIIGGTQEGKELSKELSERLRGTNVDRIKQRIADKKIDDDLPPPGSRGGPDDIAAPVQSSEETLKNMIMAENKKNIAAMKKRKMLDEAIDNQSPSLSGDRKVDADLVAEDLAERMGLVYDDMPTKERLKLYDEAYQALTKKKFDPPEDLATGGRVGYSIGDRVIPDNDFMNLSLGNITQGQNTQTAGLLDLFKDTPEEQALEQIQDLRKQENQIKNLGEGAIELKKDELQDIQQQIQDLKNQYPDDEGIQQAFDPYADIQGQTAFFDPFTVVGGLIKIKEGAKAGALAKQFLKNKAKQKLGKEITDRIQKKINPPKYPTGPIITSGGGADRGGGYTPTTTAQNVARTESRVDSSGNVKAYGLRDGGRIGFFMGSQFPKGLATLREMVKFFSKGKDKERSGSEILRLVNPKQFNKLLEDPNIYRKFDVQKGIGAPELIKNMQADLAKNRTMMVEEILGAAKNLRKSDVGTMERKKEMIEEMMRRGIDRETAEDMAETVTKMAEAAAGKKLDTPKLTDEGILELENILKNMETGGKKKRDLNADGGRIGLKDGMNRRTFLKLLGGLAAIPIIGKIIKPLKTVKGVKNVPIIKTDNVAGKPEWFDQLVNKVIIEGDDVTKRFATGERQSIHQKTLDDGSVVRVTEDVDDGAVRVEYESEDNVFGDTVQLQYKKPKADQGDPRPSAEFTTAESGPVGRRYGPDDYEIEVDEVGGSSISDLDSDVSKLKQYATGKGPTMKEIVQNKKRKDKAKRITEDPEAQSDAVVARQGEVSGEDYMYASGGIARMLGE